MEVFRFLCFLIILITAQEIVGQFNEDFADNDLSSNPFWLGDLSDFQLNDNGELQLQTIGSGSSKLFTAYQLSNDFQWEIDFRLDFSPSGSNLLRIFLFSETEDDLADSGYYLEIGQSGSEDAIKLINGLNDELIATGLSGRVASEPNISILVNLSENGKLSVSSKSSTDAIFIFEFEETIPLIETREYLFGLECRYTSSRSDKFYFNEISLGKTKEDTKAPELVDVIISDSNEFCLVFDEPIDKLLSEQEILVRVNQESIEQLNYSFQNLKFTVDPINESSFDIFIMGLSDSAGNRLDTTVNVIKGLPVIQGDLLVNEILFDPVKSGDDFVELINVSNKVLDLQGLIIQNNFNGQRTTIENQILIKPDEIVAFTENRSQLLQYYPQAIEQYIYINDLPAFNNDSGNVSLLIKSDIIESVDYSDEQHHPMLDDTEGVSLERISLLTNSSDLSNWSSASEIAGFATPGSMNSTRSIGEELDLVVLNTDSFSPNGDGDADELQIILSPKMSSIGNIHIYDQLGNPIRQIINNSLLGSNQTILWDGRLENGITAPIGIYILRIEVIDSRGEVHVCKKSVALLDFLR